MKKIKRWLTEQFLPVYLKEELMKENALLREKIREQDTHIRELNAYIEGLEYSIRNQKRLIINSREGCK